MRFYILPSARCSFWSGQRRCQNAGIPLESSEFREPAQSYLAGLFALGAPEADWRVCGVAIVRG